MPGPAGLSDFVDAYSRRTGAKQRVPRAWLARSWGAGLALTPRQKARDARATPATTEKEDSGVAGEGGDPDAAFAG